MHSNDPKPWNATSDSMDDNQLLINCGDMTINITVMSQSNKHDYSARLSDIKYPTNIAVI